MVCVCFLTEISADAHSLTSGYGITLMQVRWFHPFQFPSPPESKFTMPFVDAGVQLLHDILDGFYEYQTFGLDGIVSGYDIWTDQFLTIYLAHWTHCTLRSVRPLFLLSSATVLTRT